MGREARAFHTLMFQKSVPRGTLSQIHRDTSAKTTATGLSDVNSRTAQKSVPLNATVPEKVFHVEHLERESASVPRGTLPCYDLNRGKNHRDQQPKGWRWENYYRDKSRCFLSCQRLTNTACRLRS